MDKYDSSQLTEFPRFESESTQSGVSTFFTKLWKLPIFSPSEASDNMQNKPIGDGKQSVPPSEQYNKQEYEDTKTETGSYAVEFEGRSLPNVLKRISSLVALGSRGGTRYADTELARYWMPDDISLECYECATRFSALRRRHHCRVCGQIFCSRCCSQRVPGQIFGCAGGLRVCNYCCNVVLSYLKENDVNGEMSTDLRTLQENLQVKFPENKSQAANSGDNFMLSLEQEERSEPRTSHKEALHEVFKHLAFALPTQHHRYRLVRYNGVWRGADILQWVMDNTSNKTRAQAIIICQSLLNSGYMECMTELSQFADYALYKPAGGDAGGAGSEESPCEERSRLVESVSSYCLDLNLGDSSARLIKAPKTENKSSPSSEEENPILEHSENHSENKDMCRAIIESGSEHVQLLLRQCLSRAALPSAWAAVLYPLCQQAADVVMPDLYSSDIDVRNYVQVKKMPGGTIRDSAVIQGVVMTKNVAHRGMPQQIVNPTVLLLDCSIAYQRVEGKLTSLEPLLLQEQEYLVRCAARIIALSPRVVLVKGSVARTVQDALRVEGVALASGVRERALRRVARSTKAERVTSIDARIGMPKLGTCRNFYVKNYSSKTLMVLEGCAEPQLGCCILLRGASLQELVRVKKVVKFMLLACYNWKLERAFLGDIEATLPEAGMNFDDENDVFNKSNDDAKSCDGEKPNFDDSNFDEMIKRNPSDVDRSRDVDSEIFTKEDKSVNDAIDADVGKSIKSSNDDYEMKEKDEKAKETARFITNDTNETEDEKQTTKIARSVNNDTNEIENDKRAKETAKSINIGASEIDDPLQKAKSDKTLSCTVPIRDFSDPLRATLSVEDDVFLPKEEAMLKTDDTHGDRWSTDDAVLSMSPHVVIPAPHLSTEAGRRCPLRAHFPSPLLSPRPPLAPAAPPHTPRKYHQPHTHHMRYKEVHEFIARPLTAPADDMRVRALLAHYRATGCRLTNADHKHHCPLYNPSVIRKVLKDPETETSEKQPDAPLDPLAPENHQRLSVLLYSFSNKSANVPDFCVNPWIATMEMYGQRDISLGAFLEKYCFNGESKCTSPTCQVPMNQHVRRFVHGDVCITITCNTVGHSNVDKVKEEQNKQVMFWSRCDACGAVGRARRLSAPALSLSLAQYVRLRCLAPRYVRAHACPHPLHTHAHAFVSRLTTACFRYSKIQTFDIQLPPRVIHTRYDTRQIRDALLTQLNDLLAKGHDTFTKVTDPEAEKEHQSFKQHVEQIHLALTSTSLHEHPSGAAVVRSLWSVSDRIITGEKMVRDAVERWAAGRGARDHGGDEPADGADHDTPPAAGAGENSDSGDKEHGVTEEDEEKGDKKTVRQILSQLLSNNSSNANQNGIIISSGLIPVLVVATQIGSVVAATLASVTYQRSLRSLLTQEEDTHAHKSEHIEVLLKDGLLCRVYYAAQFHKLRHLLLAGLDNNPHIADTLTHRQTDTRGETCCQDDRDKDPRCLCDIEEALIRSLAQCVPWAAKGGKSGSTFCKTRDDRYVLKEMTKPEWQQFLEFAPHYFNYVTSCHQNNQPSLLARILGVYSVGETGTGVLVMENVWYGCSAACTRFDLKGAARHRLATDTQPSAVLMDENLLHLRWETPLYIMSHTGTVLWACIERDTDFLASHSVMDYSLLLGRDHRTLVLGIVDYIRTFTWDKKLEHLVKKNLGSGQPTVVSPSEYKRRFQVAARKYFLQCASHWDHLIQPLV